MVIPAAVSCFVAAFLALAALNWISLIPWRKTAAGHWTERARVLWPVRKTTAVLTLYVPLLLAAGSSLFWETGLSHLVPLWLAAFAGAVGGGWFMTRELFPGTRLRPWLHDVAIGWILRLAIWAVLFAAGFSMPAEFGLRTWLTLAGVAVFQLAWPFIALRLLRLPGILRPASARLGRIVADCIKDGGPRVKNLWQARGVMANAFALPLTGTLVFLDRLLEILTDEEVAAVCAHEIGHLAESKLVLLGRHLGALAVLPLLLIHPASQAWGTPGVFAMLLLVILWARLARRLVHRMEIRADAIASHQQAGDGVYARALEKIYQANHLPAVMSGKPAHPHLYDRMTAAGATPGFPRPRPPGRFTAPGWVMLVAAPFVLVWILADDFHDGRGKPAGAVDRRHGQSPHRDSPPPAF